MNFLQIAGGLLLLFRGRRLVWLFVCILGFSTGFILATKYFSGQPDWILLLIAVACGVIGVLLAFFLQRVAIAIGGFLAGAQFATALVASAGWKIPESYAFLIGGILGAILLSILFDWALIFLSSVSGAILVSRSLPLEPKF